LHFKSVQTMTRNQLAQAHQRGQQLGLARLHVLLPYVLLSALCRRSFARGLAIDAAREHNRYDCPAGMGAGMEIGRQVK
jgi:hypothetical protein